MSIGSNIETHLKKMDMTQDELAKKLGVSIGAVNQWVRGWKVPNVQRLTQIAEILETTPNDLIGVQI